MKLIMLFVSVLLLANGVEAGNHKKKCRNLEKKREKCERTSRRDSFEYPLVSKFVAPSDFWLGFVAPVSAAPAPVSVPPRMTRTPVPPSRYIIATGRGRHDSPPPLGTCTCTCTQHTRAFARYLAVTSPPPCGRSVQVLHGTTVQEYETPIAVYQVRA